MPGAHQPTRSTEHLQQRAEALVQLIHDKTATNDVALRRTLYLTIMSSANFEEAGHKLMKMGLKEGQEPELVRMIVDCCAQERTFLRFYALLAQRFCAKFIAYRRAPLLPSARRRGGGGGS